MKAAQLAKQKRNQMIREEFAKLNAQHLQHNYIYQTIAKKYFLEPLTVKSIVKQHKAYRADAAGSSKANEQNLEITLRGVKFRLVEG